jgi:hypothetical protein
MNIDDFVNLVAEMRQAQRDYFRLRSSESLTRAKGLEKQVDRAIVDRAVTDSLPFGDR